MTNVIQQDTYDKWAFEGIKEQSENLKQLEEQGKEGLPTFPSFMQDIYASLYKMNPQFVPDNEIDYSSIFNKQLIEQMFHTSQYQNLRNMTMLDEFHSAMGTVNLSQTVLEGMTQEEKERQQQVSQQQEQLQDLLSQKEALKDIMRQAPHNKHTRKELLNTHQQIKDTKQSISQSSQPTMQPGQIRRLARKACEQAQEEGEKVNNALGWGTEPGEFQKLPIEEKLRLAQQIQDNPKLKKIAEMAGRFQRMALYKQATKVNHARDEVVDTELGDDLQRVLPSELVLLTNERTKPLFYKKFSERGLLQYKLEGVERAARGPIVVCVDNSGSMRGEREIWSKAVMLGLLTIAKRQKRAFAVLHFGSEGQCYPFIFPEANPKPQEIIDLLEFFLGGGTSFQTPLSEAVRIIRESKEFKKADIIFITDGECSVSDEFLKLYHEQKEKMQFQCYGIGISYWTQSLEPFCDKIIEIHDLEQDKEVLDTIYSI